MDCSIMNAPDRGLAVDSSHRNKNENRAPVTLVTTVDESGHMVPGQSISLVVTTGADTLSHPQPPL